jgi:hypothetical protein
MRAIVPTMYLATLGRLQVCAVQSGIPAIMRQDCVTIKLTSYGGERVVRIPAGKVMPVLSYLSLKRLGVSHPRTQGSQLELILNFSASDITLTNCSDGSWCPFTNASGIECCTKGQGVFLNGTSAAMSTTSSISSSPNSTASAGSTNTATATTSPSASTGSLSPVAKVVGIATAMGAVAVILGVAGFRCLRRRRPSKSENDDISHGPYGGPGKSFAAASEMGSSSCLSELPAYTAPERSIAAVSGIGSPRSRRFSGFPPSKGTSTMVNHPTATGPVHELG